VKLQNNRIRDMIGAYRASQSIEIVSWHHAQKL
jgi:hypothetical protein